jgi:pimeloyl-ACP methyl ester carboxylesterase
MSRGGVKIMETTHSRRAGLAAFCAALAVLTLAAAGATSVGAGRAAAASAATLVPCGPFFGIPAECGTVDVPLDRAQPAAGTIPVYFVLFSHLDSSQPSLGAIVPEIGGPGVSNTAVLPIWLSIFGPLLARRDLLVIDDRGTGRSAAVDCPALQHLSGDLGSAVRACGAQLGAASGRYGSGDIADDIDAIRAALGIDKIDFYGGSFSAHNVRAYAYRHPDHLQSAVFDSPWLSQDYAFQASNARFYAQVQATVCRRSPSCFGANPDPEKAMAWLARRLRERPVDGIGYDANGVPHTVHVDESTILDILSAPEPADPPFLNQGELTAASRALRGGDTVPLLRLAAESPQSTDSGDPGFFSAGASVAKFCSDGRFPYDTSAPEATRRAQYEAAVAALPRDAFAPFSAAAWLAVNGRLPKGVPGGFPSDWCVPWPAPVDPDPAFPPNQPFPNTPTLILNSDLDVVSLDDTKANLPLFPNSHFVEVANAGHETAFWNPCAAAIVRTFIATGATGDTSCAGDVNTPFHGPSAPPGNFVPYHGVDRFPVQADDAVAARVDPSGINQADKKERQVASVAWSTVLDAFMRVPRMTPGANGRGLRGGSYTVTKSSTTTTIDYQTVRFSDDVTVTGHATRDLATNTIDAQVTVEQRKDQNGNEQGHGDERQGTLTFHGVLYTPSEPDGQVRGTLDGRQVALLVPMN